jgi:CheY-like chemotaxis protein
MDNRLALIVEDTLQIAEAFSFVLEGAGFTPEVLHDGGRVMARLEDSDQDLPDVIVLDMNLPNMDGREILRRIRTDGRLEHLQVIVATANSHMAESVKDQADIVLLKPVSFEQLRALSTRLVRPM